MKPALSLQWLLYTHHRMMEGRANNISNLNFCLRSYFNITDKTSKNYCLRSQIWPALTFWRFRDLHLQSTIATLLAETNYWFFWFSWKWKKRVIKTLMSYENGAEITLWSYLITMVYRISLWLYEWGILINVVLSFKKHHIHVFILHEHDLIGSMKLFAWLISLHNTGFSYCLISPLFMLGDDLSIGWRSELQCYRQD